MGPLSVRMADAAILETYDAAVGRERKIRAAVLETWSREFLVASARYHQTPFPDPHCVACVVMALEVADTYRLMF